LSSGRASVTHPADDDLALSSTPRVLLDLFCDAVDIVHLAADVDLEPPIVREALDRLVRPAPLARLFVVSLGEDETDVVLAVAAEELSREASLSTAAWSEGEGATRGRTFRKHLARFFPFRLSPMLESLFFSPWRNRSTLLS
jgi:hypothetical protein